jgi:hypothetical protein
MGKDEFNPDSVDAKLATIIANQKTEAEHRERILQKLEHHEGEISNLKLWRSYIVGISSAAGVVLHGAWQWITGKEN